MTKPIHLIAGESRALTPQELFPGVTFPSVNSKLRGTYEVDAERGTVTVNVVWPPSAASDVYYYGDGDGSAPVYESMGVGLLREVN